MNRALRVLLILFAVALGQIAWHFPQMPAVMATHYDGSGTPNGWMSRSTAIGFQIFMLGVVAAAFVALPWALGRIGTALINIPNREYWLAPERRAESVLSLRRWMAALGCAAVLLLMVVTELNFRTNLETPPRLPAMPLLVCVSAFLVFMVLWILGLIRRFQVPAKA